MDHEPLELSLFDDKLKRHVDPKSPPPLRMMGARGMLPAPPEQLLPLLYQLSFDSDAEVAKTAGETLAKTPADVVTAAAAKELPGPVLHRLAKVFGGEQVVLEAVLRNNATPDETHAELAATCNESISELIAQNEVRVLRHPVIIGSLFNNPAARQSTIDRLIDLARRNEVSLKGMPGLELLDDAPPEPEEKGAGDDVFSGIIAESIEEEKRLAAEEEGLSELQKDRRRADEQTEEEKGPKGKNLAAQIGNMRISEKVRLATLGSRSDRDMLIRDSNRLVHMAAVTSPKVRPRDIMAWSGNKQVADNVLVYIANHPRYRRNYNILHNLVCNPRMPVPEASKLLQSIHTKDLQALAKNRNVSGQVRRMAKNIAGQRTRGRRG